MKIIQKKLSDLSPDEIETIETFLDINFSTLFHEPNFNKIIEEVFNTQFEFSLVYKGNGRLIALCPLHSVNEGLMKITYSNPALYEVPYGGWVHDKREVCFIDLIDQMKLSFNEALRYWSCPLIDEDEFNKIKNKLKWQTALIDLEKSEDIIWRDSINQKRRNMIRKAQKSDLSIERLSISDFQDYYQLMKETYQIAGLNIKPMEYYIKILKAYLPSNNAIVLVAKKQSKLVSGLILLRNKYICHYWISARKRGVENLGQGELLQWEAIKWAKENGSRYYDLCVVEEERLPYIARFKLGFSKEIVPFYYISKKKLGFRIGSRIQRYLKKVKVVR